MTDELKRVPIKYHVPDQIHSRYATHLLVQHGEHEFILSFFEVQEPFVVGDTPEEMKQQLEQIQSVRAECVGRIVVAADRISGFIEAMQKDLERYHARG